MCPHAKCKDFYTDEELSSIRKAWIKEKSRIDEDWVRFGYNYDRDVEYKRCLHEGDFTLYPHIKSLVLDVYRRVVEYGYYSKSKKEEKSARVKLAKVVSRYFYERIRPKR
ncbi:MAG: hypothetical protein A2Z91_06150 [Deltaproteobacteria bacterium GWA2_38_16]|nr:MAG: hypothetical protein A2Z91_06150 [Deltaproteobacteria bacterium GWA2_38_16]OGQ03718.1 MAG: hypothetical protein A3D19_02635 [Deltaproteobacteria bacterium RIFCSPHIGHO2_02_FULL_38_15]